MRSRNSRGWVVGGQAATVAPAVLPGSAMVPGTATVPGNVAVSCTAHASGKPGVPGAAPAWAAATVPGSEWVPESTTEPGSARVFGAAMMPGTTTVPGSMGSAGSRRAPRSHGFVRTDGAVGSTGAGSGRDDVVGVPRTPRAERGMVTVEVAFAVMLSAVVALALCYLIALVVQLGQLQAVAGEVARQHARSDTAAARRAADDAPFGTVVRVSNSGSDVVVVAELKSQPWGRWIPAMSLSARAVVLKEGV